MARARPDRYHDLLYLIENCRLAATLTLEDTAVFTVTNSITLKGASGNLLTVTSDDGTNTVDFDLSAGGVQDLDYLTVVRIDSATVLR